MIFLRLCRKYYKVNDVGAAVLKQVQEYRAALAKRAFLGQNLVEEVRFY